MTKQTTTLITPNVQAGLELASRLADEIHAVQELARARIARPGGMNYLLPATTPKEVIASILFFAIAAANHGWASPVPGQQKLEPQIDTDGHG